MLWLSALDFQLNAEELERWFTNIDHIFEHSRIPRIGEVLTPFYKISIDREQLHHLPLVSHINYKYSLFLVHFLVEYCTSQLIPTTHLEHFKKNSLMLTESINFVYMYAASLFMPSKWAKRSRPYLSMPLMSLGAKRTSSIQRTYLILEII